MGMLLVRNRRLRAEAEKKVEAPKAVAPETPKEEAPAKKKPGPKPKVQE